MDIIDNLIFASNFSGSRPSANVVSPPPASPTFPASITPEGWNISDFVDAFPALPTPSPGAPNYQVADKYLFCTYEDINSIDTAITRHWFDIDNRASYTTNGVVRPPATPASGTVLCSFANYRPYHLIYAYLLENTRIVQIFERLVEKYITDESLGIATDSSVVAWIRNIEKLIYRDMNFYSGSQDQSRMSNDEARRRNAYWRMFGMDLAFGDIAGHSGSGSYVKAKYANQEFVPLFERYIAEIWQGHINARNTAGMNTADINILVELAIQLRELIHARRGNVASMSYAHQNLSREEYHAVLVNSWLTFIITYDSPVVQFLNCQSSTIGERLLKIGTKVGIPAHVKCQSLFEMAGAMSAILTAIEFGGVLDNPVQVRTMLYSLTPPPPPAAQPNQMHVDFMNHFLSVINNWEKATGHNIKNPDANVRGTVRIHQNGSSKPVNS